MGFQQGLSGLNATSRNLDVIGHNIANANTTGMKASRAEYGELIASSLGASGGGTRGIGVEVTTVSQQFTQGNISVTNNDLDVAINGAGFLQLRQPDGSFAYTRAGELKLDRFGYIVTNTGAQVLGYQTDLAGNRLSFALNPLQLPTAAPIGASQTTSITAEFNLDAEAAVWNSTVPPTPLTTYGTSLSGYDSQGVAIPVSLYMRKIGNDQWEVYTDPTSAATATASTVATLNFGVNGQLASTVPATITVPMTSPNPAIGTFNVTLNVPNATQFGSRFAVSDLTQDGYPPGELVGLKIEESGVIMARYSNGETQAAGQFALANFRNIQGLAPQGNGVWIETLESGQPILGAPGEGKFGTLRAGALEDSNVDLTAELVNMMTAQRAYQANAQTIKTQDQVLQTLVNLR
ncbi:MAG: flagellar hook protein FlgE [Curvibacter sp.]